MADEALEGAEVTPSDDGAEVTPEQSSEEGATQTDSANWRSGITEESDLKLAERYTSPAAMAKALREANVKISQGAPTKPGEGATDEDLAAYRESIGVPATADAYEITQPEGVTDEQFKAVKEGLTPYLELAHTHNAGPDLVDAFIQFDMERAQAQAEAQAKADQDFHEATEAALRKEWGEEYQGNMNLAQLYAEQKGYKDLYDMELSNGQLLGSFPPFAKFLAETARMDSEHSAQVGLVNTEAGVDLQKQHAELSEKIHAAVARGETDLANRLQSDREKVSEKLYGTGQVVGAGGRTI